MTATLPDVNLAEFEQLVEHAPDAITFELINGVLMMSPAPDLAHVELITELAVKIFTARPDLRLHAEAGVAIDTYRNGRARVDGALTRKGDLAGKGSWADPDAILMIVEVTSPSTAATDRTEKRDAYARTGIAIFLLIDRERGEVVVHSEPKGGRYAQAATSAYGEDFYLPTPVGLTLAL